MRALAFLAGCPSYQLMGQISKLYFYYGITNIFICTEYRWCARKFEGWLYV